MSDLKMTRKQLSEFLSSHEAIKKFENLLLEVSEVLPDNIDSLTEIINNAIIESSVIESKIQEVLIKTKELSNKIDSSVVESQIQEILIRISELSNRLDHSIVESQIQETIIRIAELSDRIDDSVPYISFLDMEKKQLDPRIAVTRAGAATSTRINSEGKIVICAVNAPRWDYDPFTLQLKGLLIEPSAVNLLLNSTIDGANLATQTRTVINGTTYVLSFYGTGTITLSGADTGVVVGTGAYPNRRTYTFTATSASLTLTVTGTVQYAMLQTSISDFGFNACSFIPTAGSSVLRDADDLSMTLSNFMSWYNFDEGSFSVEHSALGFTPSSTILSVNNNTSNDKIDISYTSAGQGGTIQEGGVTQSSYSLTPSGVVDTVYKVAMTYKLNNQNYAVDGVAGTRDTSCLVPTRPFRMQIGSRQSTFYMFGHLRRIDYYNTALTDDELEAITT